MFFVKVTKTLQFSLTSRVIWSEHAYYIVNETINYRHSKCIMANLKYLLMVFKLWNWLITLHPLSQTVLACGPITAYKDTYYILDHVLVGTIHHGMTKAHWHLTGFSNKPDMTLALNKLLHTPALCRTANHELYKRNYYTPSCLIPSAPVALMIS